MERETTPTDPLAPRCQLSLESGDVLSMLQQQQGLLQKVINNQKSLEEKHTKMEAMFANLEEQVRRDATPPSSSSTSSDGKRKRVVTRELSVSKQLIN